MSADWFDDLAEVSGETRERIEKWRQDYAAARRRVSSAEWEAIDAAETKAELRQAEKEGR